jgi:hypothetical protein
VLLIVYYLRYSSLKKKQKYIGSMGKEISSFFSTKYTIVLLGSLWVLFIVLLGSL